MPFIPLGTTPLDEPRAAVGSPGYRGRAAADARRYAAALDRLFADRPPGISFVEGAVEVGGAVVYGVAVVIPDGDDDAAAAGFRIMNAQPLSWDQAAPSVPGEGERPFAVLMPDWPSFVVHADTPERAAAKLCAEVPGTEVADLGGHGVVLRFGEGADGTPTAVRTPSYGRMLDPVPVASENVELGPADTASAAYVVGRLLDGRDAFVLATPVRPSASPDAFASFARRKEADGGPVEFWTGELCVRDPSASHGFRAVVPYGLVRAADRDGLVGKLTVKFAERGPPLAVDANPTNLLFARSLGWAP